MSRSLWLDERASLFIGFLGGHGLALGRDEARRAISDHLDLVSERMRIGRQAAKRYVTDDAVRRMASRAADGVQRHDAAVAEGRVVCLDSKRRQRLPRPPAM